MRIFTAIPFPDEIKQKTGDLLKGKVPVHYVNTTNLHITLNFFGDLPTDDVTKLQNLFEQAVAGEKGFMIEFDKLTKTRNQIHMLPKSNNSLRSLQYKLEKTFVSAGFSFQEREYYAHVKIANMHMDKVMNTQRKIENFPNIELAQLNFKADKVVLYESKLLLHHAHHYRLMEAKLS